MPAAMSALLTSPASMFQQAQALLPIEPRARAICLQAPARAQARHRLRHAAPHDYKNASTRWLTLATVAVPMARACSEYRPQGATAVREFGAGARRTVS